jgi:hypothetical protein
MKKRGETKMSLTLIKNPQFNYKLIRENMVGDALKGKGNWILKEPNAKAIRILHEKYPSIPIKELKEILKNKQK